MADTSERPANVTTAPLDATDLPPADTPRDQPYRPLSLLAILGLVLALTYSLSVLLGGIVPVATQNPKTFILLLIAAPLIGAQVALLRKNHSSPGIAVSAALGAGAFLAIVGVGGLLAYSGSNPWLILSGAGWFLVAAAVVVCWLARSRIVASEGTLGGIDLANWGLSISLISGLIYGAYLASNTFAVRAQAKETAERFIRLIADTKDPESLRNAFLMMLPPRARPTTDVRRAIEVVHNQTQDPSGRMIGPFTQFRTSQYVQLLRAGADKITFDRIGMNVYERGQYQLGLIYRVEGPLGTQFLQVGTQSVEVSDETGTRREWQIMPQGTKTEEYRPNEEARKLQSNTQMANIIYQDWLERVKRGDVDAAYLYTLPQSERLRQMGISALKAPALIGVTGVTLPGAWGVNSKVKEDFDQGLAAYKSGKLLDLTTYDFFSAADKAGEDVHRNKMIDLVKTIFRGEQPLPLDIPPASLPPSFSTTEPNCYLFPIKMVTRATANDPKNYLIEGEVQVFGVPVANSNRTDFRIGKVQLVRGQFAPTTPLRSAP